MKYHIKKDLMGRAIDIQNCRFLGIKGFLQTANGDFITSGNKTPIDTIAPYFKKIIATKGSAIGDKKRE